MDANAAPAGTTAPPAGPTGQDGLMMPRQPRPNSAASAGADGKKPLTAGQLAWKAAAAGAPAAQAVMEGAATTTQTDAAPTDQTAAPIEPLKSTQWMKAMQKERQADSARRQAESQANALKQREAAIAAKEAALETAKKQGAIKLLESQGYTYAQATAEIMGQGTTQPNVDAKLTPLQQQIEELKTKQTEFQEMQTQRELATIKEQQQQVYANYEKELDAHVKTNAAKFPWVANFGSTRMVADYVYAHATKTKAETGVPQVLTNDQAAAAIDAQMKGQVKTVLENNKANPEFLALVQEILGVAPGGQRRTSAVQLQNDRINPVPAEGGNNAWNKPLQKDKAKRTADDAWAAIRAKYGH